MQSPPKKSSSVHAALPHDNPDLQELQDEHDGLLSEIPRDKLVDLAEYLMKGKVKSGKALSSVKL